MDISLIITLVGETITLISIMVPLIAKLNKIANGTKCQHRCDILEIYYKNRESETIHQYELENFILLYEAYKALKGNSFIDKIYEEVMTWNVIP